MYRCVAGLLLSHTTGFSFSTTIDVIRKSGNAAPSPQTIRFIACNILVFYATGCNRDRQMEWNSQRDQTHQLGKFEQLSFRDTKKLLFVPLYLLATLDDDLYATRANDNQVKLMSARKVDKEGNSADAVANALFCFLLAPRFRCRGILT